MENIERTWEEPLFNCSNCGNVNWKNLEKTEFPYIRQCARCEFRWKWGEDEKYLK